MAVRAEKQAVVAEMKDVLSKANGAVLVGFNGLTVAEVTDLRRRFLEEGVEYRVIKNTLTRIAADELGMKEISEQLEGPNALATAVDDPIAPARVLEKFIKDTGTEALTIKVGMLEGKVLDKDKIVAIAKLPNREGMLSMLLSVLQAPIRNVAYAVKAVADSKDGGDETVA